MNLLFLYSATINPQLGGVERVSYTLANFFELNGHRVSFLGLNDQFSTKDRRQYYLPDSDSLITRSNIEYFRSFLIDKSIDIVINQGGTSPGTSMLASYCKTEGVRLISVVHNSLLASIENYSSANKHKYDQYGLSWLLACTDTKVVKTLLLKLFKRKYGKHYRNLCKNSDYVLLLSDTYKEELKYFMDEQPLDNVVSIHNPASFDKIVKVKKRKEILYVGRINTSQKRIDLLLQIWSQLEAKYPEWSLKVVGDGDELESIQELKSKLDLKKVYFYGHRDPKPFYQTAMIFCMTSSFEGLPMTLIEAMQYGVIPVAFNSFLSITDIIDDKINGCIITPFKIDEYVKTLSELMSSSDYLENYSTMAEESVKKFELGIIGEQWLNIFKDLEL